MNKIKLNNISKEFKKKCIFENINLEFSENHIYGIVGANGSGKSVLLKIICGLMKPTHGTVTHNGKIIGKDIRTLPSTGLIINKPEFLDNLTAFENLQLLAQIQNTINDEVIEEILKTVKLENNHKKISQFSVGMIQRLGIAQALMENPDILVLDEFSNGLDEEGVDLFHKILKSEKSNGKLIIITSHSKYDIDQLCDSIIDMNNINKR